MSDVPTPKMQIETDDMEGDIRSALDQLKTEGGVESKPEAKITLDAPKPERPRDEVGKFASKPAEEKPKRETLTLPVKESQATQQAQADVTAQAAAPTAKAPESWSAPMKEKFGALDPSVQAYITQRETEAHRALTAQDAERQFGKQVKEITQPYMAQIQAEGGDPLKAYQLYLNTAHVLRGTNEVAKAQSIAGVMQQFRVNPNLLLSVLQGGNVQNGMGLQPTPQQGLAPENVAQIVQAELAKQRQIQEEYQLQGEIEQFESSAGHEHFSQVKPVMAALLTSGQAADLQDAYDQACWANPEIRSILSSQQAKAAEEKRLTELNAKAGAARYAAGSITGAPGGGKSLNGSTNPNSSIEDDIRAAMREHAGRV